MVLQVRTLQSRLSDSTSLTARLQREMLLVKAKAEALEFSVSEKDAEIELLRVRHESQDTQVLLLPTPCVYSLPPMKHNSSKHSLSWKHCA